MTKVQSNILLNGVTDLMKRIAACCLERGIKVGVAESCTGGMVAAALTEVPGASRWFKGGVVSYSEDVKIAQLGVSSALLKRVGVVSGEVAEAMACGARRVLGVDVAVSTTGLAGPDGDGVHDVGTVFIGYAADEKRGACEYHFEGGRGRVRTLARDAALEVLLATLTACTP